MVDTLWILLALACLATGFSVGRYQRYEIARREAVEQIKQEDLMRKRREMANAKRSSMPRDDAGGPAVIHRIGSYRRYGSS